MRVDLGRRQVGVAEQFLNGTQVGATVEQVRREAVAQRVWMGRYGRSMVENAAHVSGGERFSLPVREERVADLVVCATTHGRGQESLATLAEPLVHLGHRRCAEWHLPLLGAFAHDRGASVGDIDVVQTQTAELADASPLP